MDRKSAYMRRLCLVLVLIGAVVFSSEGQDHKFSQFYNSPLNLNPALTGKLNSYYRIVANYRNQYARISTPSPYNTFAFSADAGFLREQLNDNILDQIFKVFSVITIDPGHLIDQLFVLLKIA